MDSCSTWGTTYCACLSLVHCCVKKLDERVRKTVISQHVLFYSDRSGGCLTCSLLPSACAHWYMRFKCTNCKTELAAWSTLCFYITRHMQDTSVGVVTRTSPAVLLVSATAKLIVHKANVLSIKAWNRKNLHPQTLPCMNQHCHLVCPHNIAPALHDQ